MNISTESPRHWLDNGHATLIEPSATLAHEVAYGLSGLNHPASCNPLLPPSSSTSRFNYSASRSYTLSDALRLPTSTPSSRASSHYESSSSVDNSPRTERSDTPDTIVSDIDTSIPRDPPSTSQNFRSQSHGTIQQPTPTIKEEPDDTNDRLFVLEAPIFSFSRVVEAEPQIRFRKTRSPVVEAMKRRMGVFHVDPFSSPRPPHPPASSLTLKQEEAGPAFLTFQLDRDSLVEVDDPEMQFLVSFFDDDDDEDIPVDPVHYRRLPNAIGSHSGESLPMARITTMGNPFRDFRGLVLSTDHAVVTPPSKSSSSSLPPSPGGKKTSARRRNSKSKPHICDVCQKVFPRPSALSTHMNSHTGAKPFKCPIPTCETYFTVRSNAKRHLKTHRCTSASPESTDDSKSSGTTFKFEKPVVSHVLERCPTQLRWARPSVALRPLGNHMVSHGTTSLCSSDSESDQLDDS